MAHRVCLVILSRVHDLCRRASITVSRCARGGQTAITFIAGASESLTPQSCDLALQCPMPAGQGSIAFSCERARAAAPAEPLRRARSVDPAPEYAIDGRKIGRQISAALVCGACAPPLSLSPIFTLGCTLLLELVGGVPSTAATSIFAVASEGRTIDFDP